MAPAGIKSAARDLLSFIDASPTPFHAVKSCKERLSAAGFQELKERDSWASTCTPGGKYYLTRNGSAIVAFAIGQKWKPGNPISMVAAHTDSPCLRIKPVSKRQGEGYLEVGVETYGGGQWHTWFDRDLGVAGRVMVRGADGNITQKLVHLDKPLLRIPTLAIHLDRAEAFQFNKETQLLPIAGLASAELCRQDQIKKNNQDGEAKDEEFAPLKAATQRHHSHLVEMVAEKVGVQPEQVIDFELVLFDTQKSSLGGLADEFIFAARMDNLVSTYCATEGLIESVQQSDSLTNESSIRLMAGFDHEEIGSMSSQGAFGVLLPAVIRRLSVLPQANLEKGSKKPSSPSGEDEMATAYEQTLASSFLISADMAHAIHPNYAVKYEVEHRPEMNKGPVIKINANARYATNSPGIVLMHEVAKKAAKKIETDEEGIPLQLFVVRNDSSCGSTIGPMLSAHLGTRTVDLGNPQLSMHSCRETAGADDVHHCIRLFNSFFENYTSLEKTILVD